MELAPILLKLLLIENKMVSMAVRIPTRQVIPTAMISKVSKARTKLDLIDRSETLIFSARSMERQVNESMGRNLVDQREGVDCSMEWVRIALRDHFFSTSKRFTEPMI